jgi:hypothetical protein
MFGLFAPNVMQDTVIYEPILNIIPGGRICKNHQIAGVIGPLKNRPIRRDFSPSQMIKILISKNRPWSKSGQVVVDYPQLPTQFLMVEDL